MIYILIVDFPACHVGVQAPGGRRPSRSPSPAVQAAGALPDGVPRGLASLGWANFPIGGKWWYVYIYIYIYIYIL